MSSAEGQVTTTCRQQPPKKVALLYQHFHLRNAKALRVGFPFFLIAPLTPPILAQKLFFLPAAFEPFLGLPVTGALRLAPVLRL